MARRCLETLNIFCDGKDNFMAYKNTHTSRLLVIAGFALTLALLGFVKVKAAPVTYGDNSYVFLNSSNVTFTILKGSVADSVTANSGNVIATISSATGGSFTLNSNSTDLTVSASSGGGTITQTCLSGNIAQVVISQTSGSTNYTISPTSFACNPPITSALRLGVGGSVSIGSGGGYYVAPVSSTSTTAIATSSQPTTIATITNPSISDLQLILSSLIIKAQQLGISIPSSLMQLTGKPTVVFTKDLKYGSSGSDVMALQKFLIAKGSGLAAGKLSTYGATGYFGVFTKSALIEYQKTIGIRATGYFGPQTRAYINSH